MSFIQAIIDKAKSPRRAALKGDDRAGDATLTISVSDAGWSAALVDSQGARWKKQISCAPESTAATPAERLAEAVTRFGVDQPQTNVARVVLSMDDPDLELVDHRFYHLDTCFCPLAANEAIYFPAAFDLYGRKVLETHVERLLVVDEAEAVPQPAEAPDLRAPVRRQAPLAIGPLQHPEKAAVAVRPAGPRLERGHPVPDRPGRRSQTTASGVRTGGCPSRLSACPILSLTDVGVRLGRWTRCTR